MLVRSLGRSRSVTQLVHTGGSRPPAIVVFFGEVSSEEDLDVTAPSQVRLTTYAWVLGAYSGVRVGGVWREEWELGGEGKGAAGLHNFGGSEAFFRKGRVLANLGF